PLPSLIEVVPPAAQATPSVAAATPSVAAMTPPSDGERVRSSPAARKRAQQLGVDIASVRGTGPQGRINIEDVEAAAGGPAAARAAPGGNGVPEKREPLSRMRRVVAEAMTRSVREAPQFSISRDVDMSNADRRRKVAGASYTDVIVSAAAKALRAHPRLRSRLDGDALVTTERMDVGIAIALDAGLIVPVVRDAETKGLAALKDERERLEAAVRSGHAPGDAFGGAAITVSNLGTLGVDRFTAIVNPPEAAILAVGRVADREACGRRAPRARGRGSARGAHGDRDRGLPARGVVLPPRQVPLVRGRVASRRAQRADRRDVRQGHRASRSIGRALRGALRIRGHPGHPPPAASCREGTARDPRPRPRLGEGGALRDRERIPEARPGDAEHRWSRPGRERAALPDPRRLGDGGHAAPRSARLARPRRRSGARRSHGHQHGRHLRAARRGEREAVARARRARWSLRSLRVLERAQPADEG